MKGIQNYPENFSSEEKSICEILEKELNKELSEAESKIWHAHPVWFIEGNPVVGYSKVKAGIRLMFWSGMEFEEADLVPGTGKFRDASITYQTASQINLQDLNRWLKKARDIQWDYKNIVKRKGKLERLK
ncbi:MAG: DUF1801 domain-containing protein [Cytophagaceae bacterium]|jgi:hypothetical protein|nr:DUF1801 domain-containing protein [Cytophagaceae bacterium]